MSVDRALDPVGLNVDAAIVKATVAVHVKIGVREDFADIRKVVLVAVEEAFTFVRDPVAIAVATWVYSKVTDIQRPV